MSNTESFRSVLIEEAARVGVTLPPSIVEGCVTHYGLMVRWNATHNLTRVIDPEDAAVRHYLDCLLPLMAWSVSSPVPTAFLDIGSGAGFPGLLAGLLWHGSTAGLIEPARKRASFLSIAAGAMGVRAQVRSPGPWTSDVVLSRATFSSGVRETLWPYVESGGSLLVWSTHHDEATWSKTVSTWVDAALTLAPYDLPGFEGRMLVVVRRS